MASDGRPPDRGDDGRRQPARRVRGCQQLLRRRRLLAWYDAPPVAAADSRITGSLKLAFDASESVDSDGEIEFYEWSFGDGNATGQGDYAEHLYPEEGNYDIKLTIEDDGGNEVVYSFEVVAIKGILTTGAQPIDFIGVDKHLRCSVVRDGPLLADGGGACGTFVALGGTVYGWPAVLNGHYPGVHAREPGR